MCKSEHRPDAFFLSLFSSMKARAAASSAMEKTRVVAGRTLPVRTAAGSSVRIACSREQQ